MSSPIARPNRPLTSEQEHLVGTLTGEVYPLCQAMEAKIKRLAGADSAFSADHVFGLIREYALLRLDGNTKKTATEIALKPLKDYLEVGYGLLAQKEHIGSEFARRERARDRGDLLREVDDILKDFMPERGTGRA